MFTQVLPAPFSPLHQTTTIGQAHLCHQTSEVKGSPGGLSRSTQHTQNVIKCSASSCTCARTRLKDRGIPPPKRVILPTEVVATEGLRGHWWTSRGEDTQGPASPTRHEKRCSLHLQPSFYKQGQGFGAQHCPTRLLAWAVETGERVKTRPRDTRTILCKYYTIS